MQKIPILIIIFSMNFITHLVAQEKQVDYEIIVINDSVVLKKIELLDEQLLFHLHQILNEKNETLKEYIYVIQFSIKSRDDFSMQISLVPSIVLKNENIGFFRVEENLFVIKGNYPCSTFNITERSEIVHYEEYKMVKGEIIFDFYSRPEQFYSWFLTFKDGVWKESNE